MTALDLEVAVDASSRGTRRRATRPAGPAVEDTRSTAILDTPVSDEAAVIDTAESDSAGSDTAEPAPPRRLRRRIAVASFVIVLLALAAVSTWAVLADQRTTNTAAQRDRLLTAARQTALNMTTLQADTAQQDVDRLLAGASGDFLAQFQDRQSDFVDVVGQAGVDSTGTVVAAGIESMSGGCAVALVAADAQVSNVETQTPTPRSFRFRITVCDTEGAITATDVEFVP